VVLTTVDAEAVGICTGPERGRARVKVAETRERGTERILDRWKLIEPIRAAWDGTWLYG
jgi:hypothetical protein